MKMYYEIHGGGEPVVLLHGAFMTITNNWAGWIGELSETYGKSLPSEMQGHGRTADVPRDFTYPKTSPTTVAALLNYLKIPRADLIGVQHGRSRGDGVCDPPPGQKCGGQSSFRPRSAVTA